MPAGLRVLMASLFAASLIGCPTPPEGAGGSGDDAAPAPSAATTPESDVAARVGTARITVTEVDDFIKEGLFNRATRGGDPSQLHQMRSQALQQMVEQRVVDAEAAARGQTREDLIEAAKQDAEPVTDDEIAAFYEENAESIEQPLDAVSGAIRTQLERQRTTQAVTAYVSGLVDAADVEIRLEPPRVEVEAEGPALGAAEAPVTIVEFSDYQCPFCKRAEPTVKQVLARYPDQVRFVYRHFPLDRIHPQARPAAEAAGCAGEQGRFWEFHAAVFEATPELGTEKLVEIAGELELDVDAFQACIDEGRFKESVQKDLEAGRRAGVTGTPAFFVNGIPLTGARSLDEFSQLIDAEIARSQGS